ncbi:MAG: vWA domain-containing protein [Lentisphaerota bacterium]
MLSGSSRQTRTTPILQHSNTPMHPLRIVFLFLFLNALSCQPRSAQPPPAPEEGLALAIVYDTSGSMSDPVINAAGAHEKKYLIARRALDAILDQLADYAAAAQPGATRAVKAELIVLASTKARVAIPLQPFHADRFKKWIDSFNQPAGGTPLGKALEKASSDLLASPLTRKHILVLTDGENTEGPTPESVMPGLIKQAGTASTKLQFHFVAFNVAGAVFNPIKNLGATVVSANDETQLNEQLEFILQKKILLENEEPPLNK